MDRQRFAEKGLMSDILPATHPARTTSLPQAGQAPHIRAAAQTLIVVPCYNEAERLDTGAFLKFAAEKPDVRFLLVNDGSTDATREVLEGLARIQPAQFAVLHLAQNQGKAEAVRQGILHALRSAPGIVGYWDADLATPLEAIDQLKAVLLSQSGLRIVMGARVKLLGRRIERRAMRHYLGRVFATAASSVLGLGVYDTQCGAKLFRVCDETQALFLRPFCSRWVFDVELLARFVRGRMLARAAPAEEAIYEYPLHQWRDVAGSKVRPWDFFRAFFELSRIYWRYLRGLRPRREPAPGLALPAADRTALEPATGAPPPQGEPRFGRQRDAA